MSANTFGRIFRLTSFGESHGKSIGGIIDGFPSNFHIDMKAIQQEVNRRRTNSGIHSSKREEADQVEFLSGIFKGKTLGTPIAFMVQNKDAKSKDYNELKDIYRPSHGDYTWEAKFGHRDYRGGGRASARETLSRVVAGAFAKQWLAEKGIKFTAWVRQIGEVSAMDSLIPTYEEIEASEIRCPDQYAEAEMLKEIENARKAQDSLGGIVHCEIEGVPAGLGEPIFDKLQAELAKAMISIPAAQGFEYGSGFIGAQLRGSINNDEFEVLDGKISTKTNLSGGIQGGISNGQNIYFNVAFKPVATIGKEQETVNRNLDAVKLKAKGRHDVCVVPRAVPIVEAMAAMVILDFYLIHQ
ncbi:MAG: chorismate synthase [Bacteroidetes bacterium]|nr:MAG: chorismate synthase [Bacteroidota bacterium]